LLLTLFDSLRQYSFHCQLLLILIFHAFLQKSVYPESFLVSGFDILQKEFRE